MALIVEDGTGKPDAESYITTEEADTYHDRMGNDSWASIDSTRKEAMLRRATRFLDGIYGIRANGIRKESTQALVFPQIEATYFDGSPIPEDTVPQIYKDAQAEAALLASQGVDLVTTIGTGPRLKRDKVDVLEQEWFESSYDAAPVFGWLDAILTPLFGPRVEEGAMHIVRVERA